MNMRTEAMAGGHSASDDSPELPPHRNGSGIDIPELVTADMVIGRDPGLPGQFPFTRGIFPNGYRGRLWTFRQYSGFGTAEETNARYRFLLNSGSTGLSVALDLPTQCGYDPDDVMASGEVGK